ncbi:hypothetical protein P4O66_001309 [Electrophorus voltai]|uniref:Uncharacterized protein n=1 Tax=Electrophorus voltai TaxID=2609070 RepID=A0AAD8ZAS5_9TELE|nr:hypothetical protein P4O66_001309 [Electrophorus voltai]
MSCQAQSPQVKECLELAPKELIAAIFFTMSGWYDRQGHVHSSTYTLQHIVICSPGFVSSMAILLWDDSLDMFQSSVNLDTAGCASTGAIDNLQLLAYDRCGEPRDM